MGDPDDESLEPRRPSDLSDLPARIRGFFPPREGLTSAEVGCSLDACLSALQGAREEGRERACGLLLQHMSSLVSNLRYFQPHRKKTHAIAFEKERSRWAKGQRVVGCDHGPLRFR